MVVLGDFINDGGHEVIIRGDLHAQNIDFDRADLSLPQSNFTVDGDLIFTQMSFRQSGEFQAQLRVGGDLIGSAGFSGTLLLGDGVPGSLGVPGSPGLSVIVYGDLIVTDVRLFGGENAAGLGGNGGSLVVYGDCLVASNLDLSGGNAEDGDAGTGGYLNIYGNLSVPDGTASVRGGSAVNGNAGNAGSVNIDGNFTGSEISAYGGNCDSDSYLHRSGNGGGIYIYGQVFWSVFLNVSGGNRFGTLSTGNTLSPPDAGYVTVNGGLSCNDISARGGSVYTSNFAPHNAGNGGYLSVNGSLNVADDLQLEGGDADYGDGGYGGSIDCEGIASIEDDFDINGGYADSGNAGNGGSAYFYSDCSLDEARMYGGNSNGGNGGNGAYLFVKGNLNVNEFYNGSGGDISTVSEAYRAGYGGEINVEGDFLYYGDDDNLYLKGGDRYGLTTIPDARGFGAFGGNLSVGGNFTASNSVYLSGGGVFTSYPNAPGGNGGNLTVRGDLVSSSNIELSGGQSVGNTGGQGGSLVVLGKAGFTSFTSTGGDSNESVALGDAGRAGRGGFASFKHGVVATDSISMRDGIPGPGGSSAIGVSELRLGGYCTVSGINMELLALIRPFPFGGSPVILKTDVLINKNTLNWADGTATGDVSALVPSNLFITNSGIWYSVAGLLVP
jgi:hypothetical protein